MRFFCKLIKSLLLLCSCQILLGIGAANASALQSKSCSEHFSAESDRENHSLFYSETEQEESPEQSEAVQKTASKFIFSCTNCRFVFPECAIISALDDKKPYYFLYRYLRFCNFRE